VNWNIDLQSEKFSLEAINICKAYKGVAVVENFNINLSKGDVIGLVGDNGTGKSTIMRIIALIDRLDSGNLIINGKNAYENIKYYRSKIGYIPQSNAIIEEMTAIDNLKLFSLLNKKETILKIIELSEAFNMNDFMYKKVKHLSGGMKRRVNIAAGIINNPRIIIADEPFAGLDSTQRKRVIEYFKKLSNNGVGQLITSHYVENLRDWSKSIIAI